MITVTGPHREAIRHLLEHLREADREEMDASRGPWSVSPVSAEIYRVALVGLSWIFWHPKKGPVAMIGAYRMTRTCAGVWAFGTDDWPLAVISVTRHVRRVMIPRLLEAGFHRAECRALFKRSDTKRWLTFLGARAEAVLSEFGARREDFILFAWLADEQTRHPSRDAGRSRFPLRGDDGHSCVDEALPTLL